MVVLEQYVFDVEAMLVSDIALLLYELYVIVAICPFLQSEQFSTLVRYGKQSALSHCSHCSLIAASGDKTPYRCTDA